MTFDGFEHTEFSTVISNSGHRGAAHVPRVSIQNLVRFFQSGCPEHKVFQIMHRIWYGDYWSKQVLVFMPKQLLKYRIELPSLFILP